MSSEDEIVAVDSVSPTVFVLTEDGDIRRWFDCSEYMREPSDIAINGELEQNTHCLAPRNVHMKYISRVNII